MRALKAPDALRAVNMAASRSMSRDQQQEGCERDLGRRGFPNFTNFPAGKPIGVRDCQTAAPVPCLHR